MPLKNTKTQYGTISKSFHWGMALVVPCLIALGFLMGELPNNSTKLAAYGLHKSFGIAVLALAACRLCWRSMAPAPGLPDNMRPWEKALAHAMHAGLYVLMFAMPLSGWLMSSAAGRPVQFFGLFILPDLVAPDKEMKIFREAHEAMAFILLITVGLHVAAAFKHHFIDKDNILKRMLPGLLLLTVLLPSSADAAGAIRKWNVLHPKSSLSFQAKQMGTAFEGSFSLFTADISFDPARLDASKAVVSIDTASAATGAADRDEALKGEEWFDAPRFPAARFETKSFRKTGENAYEAKATLTIKNVSVPLTLPFTLRIEKVPDGNLATMDGSLTLKRSDFKLGQGQWVDASIIANEVLVHIHLVAMSGH